MGLSAEEHHPSLGITLAPSGAQAADRRLNHFLRASGLPAPAGFDISVRSLTDKGLVPGCALEACESLFKLLLQSVDLLSLLVVVDPFSLPVCSQGTPETIL